MPRDLTRFGSLWASPKLTIGEFQDRLGARADTMDDPRGFGAI